MPEPAWHRSLYWRTAIGAFACLTGMLLAQAALFLWLASRSDRPLLGQSAPRVLRIVSLDLSAALESDPALDLSGYVRDQFGRLPWLIFVVQPSGAIATNRDFQVPAQTLAAARQALTDRKAQV